MGVIQVDGANTRSQADQTGSGPDVAAQQNVFDGLRGDPDKASPQGPVAEHSESPPPASTSSRSTATDTRETADTVYRNVYDSTYKQTYDTVYRATYAAAYKQQGGGASAAKDADAQAAYAARTLAGSAARAEASKQAGVRPPSGYDAAQTAGYNFVRKHGGSQEDAMAAGDQIGLREKLEAQMAQTTDPSKLAQLKQSYQTITNALISSDVYNSDGASNPFLLPPGVSRVTDPAQLAKLGLKPSDLADDPSGFYSAVYYNENTQQYTVANRGTEDIIKDGATDAAQALGMHTTQFEKAAHLASLIQGASHDGSLDGKVVFTGHSLGGGLAAAEALKSGFPAETFNSAGLSQNTCRELHLEPGKASQLIHEVAIRGEIVNLFQGAGWALSPLMAGVGNAPALGAHERLPPVGLPDHNHGTVRPGRPYLGGQGPALPQHSMNYVVSSLFYAAGSSPPSFGQLTAHPSDWSR